MADPRIKRLEDGTVEPAPGWEWCPYCDGEGFSYVGVYLDEDGHHMDERAQECGFCDDGIREAMR